MTTIKERLAIDRQDMPVQDAGCRSVSFTEVNQGYDLDAAVVEATRCLECKNAKCMQGCPVQVDIPRRYERSRISAQSKVDADVKKATITNTSALDSKTEDHRPYEHELESASELRQIPLENLQPTVPAGKATQQAASSREQVLEDTRDGGAHILAEEAQEEKEARSMVRKSNRRRAASSLTQSDSLRGLRERVSIHGRTGGMLGMESGR